MVVTYNRKELLERCLNAILTQKHPIEQVLIVDNASTDGTEEHLSLSGFLRDNRVRYVRLQENIGGAGGFNFGLRMVANLGVDYVWIMDDDTIPNADALAALVESATCTNDRLGFVCSKVIWNTGDPHLMNIPVIKPIINGYAFNCIEKFNCLLIEACSFVSVIISREAIKAVGLPIKDMFIWADDIEYTTRITRAGFLGAYCNHSIVLHATMENYKTDIFTDKTANLWRYRFGIRNNLYIIRRTKGYTYFMLKCFYNITALNIKIFVSRDADRLLWITTNTIATLRSLIFYPIIEHIHKSPENGRSSVELDCD